MRFQQTAMSYQVHGRAPRRMRLDKQLRWRLSKVLYLRLHGLQGRRVTVIINTHQQGGSRHSLTMQVYPVSHEKSPENSWGALLSGCRIVQVLVFCRQALHLLRNVLLLTKSLFLCRSWG